MRIKIVSIPHHRQRYETVGDWWRDDEGTLQIRVSHMEDERYEQLVAVHELVEVLLCEHAGITTEAVDAFDKAFEAKRADGSLEDLFAEPGDDPKAPYHLQHGFASSTERMLAAALGVNWKEYDAAVMAL